MQETQVQSLGQEDPLKKEMATRSGILAWKIPWTEKTGRLQSIGSQRVGHDWATNTFSISLSTCFDVKATSQVCSYQTWNNSFQQHLFHTQIIMTFKIVMCCYLYDFFYANVTLGAKPTILLFYPSWNMGQSTLWKSQECIWAERWDGFH